MKRWVVLCMVVVAVAATSRDSAAREFRPPTLVRALRALGPGYTVPAAWAGVYTYTDTTRDCTTRVVTGTDSGLDTLCTGQSMEPDTTGGFQYDCTGTVTDNQVDLTCTGSYEVDTGCTANFTSVIHATRTGETTVSVGTFTTAFDPVGCAFIPDMCFEVTSRTTRIAGEPASCSTPTRSSTWGALKSTYR